MLPATKNRLGARLAVCQLVGTICGLAATSFSSSGETPKFIDIELLGLGALVLGIPAYALAVLVLHNFTRSILNHMLLWCIGLPGALLAMSLTLHSPPGAVHWTTAMALSALLAGLMFLIWQRVRPMALVT